MTHRAALCITILGLAPGAWASDVRVGAGLGVTRGGTTVGRQSSDRVAMGGNALLRFGRSVRWGLEVDVQPYRIDNPVRQESFRSTYVLPSVELGAQAGPYLRLGVGGAHRSWSGPDVWVSSELSPAAGLAVGHEFKVAPNVSLSPEAFGRVSVGDEITTRLYGARVVVVWHAH